MDEIKNIPKCTILGVNIAVVNMQTLLQCITSEITKLSGEYICVSNVHTTVTSYRDEEYRSIQNGAVLAIPDGAPLSVVGRKRGYTQMGRTAGPDLMTELFQISQQKHYRHFFYGTTERTLELLRQSLEKKYPGIQIVGTYAPPFRELTKLEEESVIKQINDSQADIVWVALGAPKQEKWMANHKGVVHGLMIGVGAGFDFHAGTIKRAPKWMQKCNLEWLFRISQDPKRLLKRYWSTNMSFIWNAMIRGK